MKPLVRPAMLGIALVAGFLFWEATKSPVICVPPGWQTMGPHWVNDHGEQCSYMNADQSWIRYLHPEEGWH